MNQREIEIQKAMDARDVGMERAAGHANREESEWTGQALGFLALYARTIGRPFLAEEARVWAENNGLPPPPDGRAWGAVVKRAQAKGRIAKAGYGAAASSNMSPKVLWTIGPRHVGAGAPATTSEPEARRVAKSDLATYRMPIFGTLEAPATSASPEPALTLVGQPIPEALACLRVVNADREDLGTFAQVVKGFYVRPGESLVEAATRALPTGCVAYFPPDLDDSAIVIEGRAQA